MNAATKNDGQATIAAKLGWGCENERLLEKLRAKGVEVRSFEGWKLVGKWVKKGEKQKAFRVQSGVYKAGIDPITGEDHYEPLMKTCYGFQASQVK
jgi:hypothetical protein